MSAPSGVSIAGMSKPSSPRRLAALSEAPWALMPDALSRIVAWDREDGDPAKVVALSGVHDGASRVGSVQVIPVYGVIEHRSDWLMEAFGGVAVETLRADIHSALADPSVAAIVLDIDSPGGSVAGMTELAGDLRAARGGSKPIVAVADTLAASAAYWLASQADELVVSPSGSVGSIGVYAIHQEASRMLDEAGITTTIVSAGPHKSEGNEFEPLTDEARADIQERVDISYSQFLADVAAGRRVPVEKVEADYGGGRVLTARKAHAAGMVDRVETLAQTVARLGSTAGRRRALSAEAGELEEPLPFHERLEAVSAEAYALVGHARERARLRAKDGRPAFSTTTETSLRSIRDAIDGLLALDEPGPDEPPDEPDEPAPPEPTPPPVAVPLRFRSREAWLRHLEA
jgi:signal peptide peptidase SppA